MLAKPTPSTAGFSLVATLLGMTLLAGVVLALVALATIELQIFG